MAKRYPGIPGCVSAVTFKRELKFVILALSLLMQDFALRSLMASSNLLVCRLQRPTSDSRISFWICGVKSLFDDVGEHIPLAKKELNEKTEAKYKPSRSDGKPLCDLKTLWLEPDWLSMYLDGVEVNVLAHIYSIYHGLGKLSHSSRGARFGHTLITSQMWDSAYEETILFIRDGCENATSVACLEALKTSFRERFNTEGPHSYRAYAAGLRTPRSFIHPFGNVPSSYLKDLLPLLDWPLSVNANKIKLHPVQLINKASQETYYVLGKSNKKSISWDYQGPGYTNHFSSYREAVDALVKYHGEEFTVKNKDNAQPLYKPKKPILDLSDHEDEWSEITPENLMSTFKFRGVQFGNFVPQSERRVNVANTYKALLLLCGLMKMPPSWIGAGKLGIAFGARGHGYAAAHYEPDLHVINLTRFNGIGCIGHEVWHSLDARVASKWFGIRGLLSELMEGRNDIGEEISEEYNERWVAFKEIFTTCMEQSSFKTNAMNLQAQKGGAKYWGKPSELLARAFEAYVEDALIDAGIPGKWLACGTKEEDYPLNGMHPYPTGPERTALNRVFLKNLPILFGKP